MCGLAAINILDFAAPYDYSLTPAGLGLVGFGLWILLYIFGMGKFYSLFSLLFGAGMVLQTRQIDQAGGKTFAAYFPRLGWLFVFGMLHAYLIWYGDILVAYAITGLVVFWCRQWSPKRLVLVGSLVLGAAIVFWAVILVIIGLVMDSAGWREFFAEDEGIGWDFEDMSVGWLQGGLRSVGRMAFSNYIGQSLIFHLLFYGTGLGMYGQLDLCTVMLFPPVIWLLQIAVSVIWLRYFKFGPLEWLWRSLSYGKRLPLRAD